MGYFQRWGGLEPHERVLDVGSGIGRMATALTGYLTEGRYEGFDVVADGIKWCQDNISSRHPQFRFQLIDVGSDVYSPEGRVSAAEYRFPFEDESFDFVILTSVFTHLLPAALENYLSEIVRVLRPGGRSFITYFILDEVSLALLGKGRSTLAFLPSSEVFQTTSPDVPESAIAYPQDYLHSLYNQHALRPVEPILYGHWSGREPSLDYQDIVIALKQ